MTFYFLLYVRQIFRRKLSCHRAKNIPQPKPNFPIYVLKEEKQNLVLGFFEEQFGVPLLPCKSVKALEKLPSNKIFKKNSRISQHDDAKIGSQEKLVGLLDFSVLDNFPFMA